MTVKTSISLTDRHHQFANRKVKDGVYASLSSLIAASVEQLMQDEQEREAALEAMQETIQERMKLPKEQWVKMDMDMDMDMDNEDPLFADLKKRIEKRT